MTGATKVALGPYVGNELAEARKQNARPVAAHVYGHRFCESCRRTVKRDQTPAKKGWKCPDCRGMAGRS